MTHDVAKLDLYLSHRAAVRRWKSSRLKWLDLHSMLDIVTLTWALVVGATGMINTWADLVVKVWQFDQLADMTAPYRGKQPVIRWSISAGRA